jgi:hypothetical protein
MQSIMQIFPFVLIIVYLGISIFVLTLIARFVTAHERIAAALETTASNSRRSD